MKLITVFAKFFRFVTNRHNKRIIFPPTTSNRINDSNAYSSLKMFLFDNLISLLLISLSFYISYRLQAYIRLNVQRSCFHLFLVGGVEVEGHCHYSLPLLVLYMHNSEQVKLRFLYNLYGNILLFKEPGWVHLFI